jgi:hypothetical protein
MKFLKGNNAVSEHYIHFYVNVHLISINFLPTALFLFFNSQTTKRWKRKNKNNKIFNKVQKKRL